MSKMSQLHATLDEQAMELGFEGLGEALLKGYDVDYENHTLVKKVDMLKQAHKAWLEERQQVLNELVDVIHDDSLDWVAIVRRVEHAIEFIERGEV